MAWGAGQKIIIGEAYSIERAIMWFTRIKRTVTDVTELWNGMDYSNAATKASDLVTAGYTNVIMNYVGGGQYTVQGLTRTFGAWGYDI